MVFLRVIQVKYVVIVAITFQNRKAYSSGIYVGHQLFLCLYFVIDIASFEEATTKYPNAFRGIPEDTKKLFKDIPLLGTDNLIFSNIVSYDDTDNDISALRGKRPAVTARTFASATSEANRDNRCPTMLYPYSDRVLGLYNTSLLGVALWNLSNSAVVPCYWK